MSFFFFFYHSIDYRNFTLKISLKYEFFFKIIIYKIIINIIIMSIQNISLQFSY